MKLIDGTMVPVLGNDIDTDQIVPARFLKCVTFDALGKALFYDQRFDELGNGKGHNLDLSAYQGASILLSDQNFGCGSSREHAPQALQKFGIQVVIAGSFAEIFYSNCRTIGIPCLMMSDDDRSALKDILKKAPDAKWSIDLEALTITSGDQVLPFKLSAPSQKAFLSGTYDPLTDLLKESESIAKTSQALGYGPPQQGAFS